MIPKLIQGGMGVGVSGWRLAREVAVCGQLGVVSGTALDTILVRRLQLGDPGGYVRRALATFPALDIAARVVERYFRNGAFETTPSVHDTIEVIGENLSDDRTARQNAGESQGSPGTRVRALPRFHVLPLPGVSRLRSHDWLLVLANFVEVYLAKEGHDGVVGINYLHKVQAPLLPSLYGAMLADVDVVLMGAGIPADIPAILDQLARNEPVSLRFDVHGTVGPAPNLTFDAAELWADAEHDGLPRLRRPKFLPIVSSATLACALAKKAPGGIDGFVVEASTAGGHNAPPRGPLQLSERGEPVYGARDNVDLAKMRDLGIPFWLAGGFASPERLEAAIAAGARGVQLGTVFAFCDESGLDPALKTRFLECLLAGDSDVHTDPLASPTSFPFKVAPLSGTLSEREVYARRPRVCDLGYLRRAYARADGTIGYRCPAEPVSDYVAKGGSIEDTVGRKCLCNALLANIGLGQHRNNGYEEPALLTAGKDVDCIRAFITPECLIYHARDVIRAMLRVESR